MSKMRSFRMDDDLYARLGEIAEDRKTTRTEVLRDLILHEHAKWYIAAIAGAGTKNETYMTVEARTRRLRFLGFQR